MLYIDFTTYKWLNGLAYHHDGLEDTLRLFAVYAQWAFLALLAALFLVRGKWRTINGRHGVVAAGFSALLALGMAQLIADLWARPRPYVTHAADAHLFIAQLGRRSFPSDRRHGSVRHRRRAAARHRKVGMLALVLAVLVSVGRVAVGTHYPTDVLAGATWGVCRSGDLAPVGAGAAAPPGGMGRRALRTAHSTTLRPRARPS